MLSPDQEAACDMFSDFLADPDINVMVLRGSAGTGKSFVTQHLLRIAEAQVEILNTLVDENNELKFAATASTNKAASVIGDVTKSDGYTVHSYLQLRVRNNYKNGTTSVVPAKDFQVTEDTLMLVDEAGMLDTSLLEMIEKATCKCKVLFIGDPYQLTPIFESNCPVFEKGYTTANLTTIHRQAKENPIINLADRLRNTVETGEFFDLPYDGENIIKVTGPEFQQIAEQAYLAQTSPDDNKILAWKNRTVNNYNAHIRALFTQESAPQVGELLVSNSIVKDPISSLDEILIGNDEKVVVQGVRPYNLYDFDGYMVRTVYGEVFMPEVRAQVDQAIKDYAKLARQDKSKAPFYWSRHFDLKERIADLRPVYASTIYKAQGSTYTNVYINLTDLGSCNQPSQVARMLYVAITRASEKVYLYGELPPKYRG